MKCSLGFLRSKLKSSLVKKKTLSLLLKKIVVINLFIVKATLLLKRLIELKGKVSLFAHGLWTNGHNMDNQR